MGSYFAAKISILRVANLANIQLVAAIRALKLNVLTHNLLRPELIRSTLDNINLRPPGNPHRSYRLPADYRRKSRIPGAANKRRE